MIMVLKDLLNIYRFKELIPEKNHEEFKFDKILEQVAKLLRITGYPEYAIEIYRKLKKFLKLRDSLLEWTLRL